MRGLSRRLRTRQKKRGDTMRGMHALYVSAKTTFVLVGTGLVAWHLLWTHSLYELLALAIGIFLGAWLRES